MNDITIEIETIISKNISDAFIIVSNTDNDFEHFEAIVISKTFDDLSLLKQHQAVMTPLKEAFKERVHALALKTFSLKNWEEKKNEFPTIEKIIKEKYKL